eukprot:GHVS01089731.1.p1 GENE.GHVS01089731.1~~GHVS01089731.1.p1  ORF type:complete len:158 (+),score=22.59 GHVS01089731.1:715-1188(+)
MTDKYFRVVPEDDEEGTYVQLLIGEYQEKDNEPFDKWDDDYYRSGDKTFMIHLSKAFCYESNRKICHHHYKSTSFIQLDRQQGVDEKTFNRIVEIIRDAIETNTKYPNKLVYDQGCAPFAPYFKDGEYVTSVVLGEPKFEEEGKLTNRMGVAEMVKP